MALGSCSVEIEPFPDPFIPGDAALAPDGSAGTADASPGGADASARADAATSGDASLALPDAGTRPDAAADPCAGQTCSGHGSCVASGSIASCRCDSGYEPSGLTCVAVNPCAGQACSGHGACVASGATATCQCDSGYRAQGLTCVVIDPCAGQTCSGHGTCQVQAVTNVPKCACDAGYHESGLACVSDTDPCAGQLCSGKGTCKAWKAVPVCACDAGYSPTGLTCVPTSQLCKGGPIDFDVDGDGTKETWFDPNAEECEMFELINRTRATHDDEGTHECHTPLAYDVNWSAHGRNHSMQCQKRGSLFHADYPWGQNCAYGCDAACEMNMYMTGPSEPHCDAMSHHCNIMRCGFSAVGIGTYGGTWNTQNFY